jgi:hypothetical protein
LEVLGIFNQSPIATQTLKMLSSDASPNAILAAIADAFRDYAVYPSIEAKLRQAIRDSGAIDLKGKSIDKVAHKYFDVSAFKSEEQKAALIQIELIFKCCYILILSWRESVRCLLWTSVDELLDKYPQFMGADKEEQHLLLRYRNAVVAALTVFPAHRNKARIMKIAERLEGACRDYITGGGQSLDVIRRVQIYEQEGGVTAEKRDHRDRPLKMKRRERSPERSSNSSKAFTAKKVKLATLSTEDRGLLSAKAPAHVTIPPGRSSTLRNLPSPITNLDVASDANFTDHNGSPAFRLRHPDDLCVGAAYHVVSDDERRHSMPAPARTLARQPSYEKLSLDEASLDMFTCVEDFAGLVPLGPAFSVPLKSTVGGGVVGNNAWVESSLGFYSGSTDLEEDLKRMQG